MRNISDVQDNVGDTVGAGRLNQAKDEPQNMVESAGITLDAEGGPDNNLYMLAQAASAYACVGSLFSDVSDSPNTVLLTRGGSAIVSPIIAIDGLRVIYKAKYTNSGAVTITVGQAIAAVDLVDSAGSDLVAGAIQVGEYVNAVYRTSAPFSGKFELVPTLSKPTETVRVTYEEVSANGGGYGDLLQRTGAGTSTANAWVSRRLSNVYGATHLVSLSKYDPGDTYNTIMTVADGKYDFSLNFLMRETYATSLRIVNTAETVTYFKRACSHFTQSDNIPSPLHMTIHGTITLSTTTALRIQMSCSVSRTATDAFGWAVASVADKGPNIYCDLMMTRRSY